MRRSERLWHGERRAVQLVESDTVLRDVDPKIFAAFQPAVHLFERVDNDVHGQRDRSIAQDVVLGEVQIFGNLGEVGVDYDDKKIKIGPLDVLGIIVPGEHGTAQGRENGGYE